MRIRRLGLLAVALSLVPGAADAAGPLPAKKTSRVVPRSTKARPAPPPVAAAPVAPPPPVTLAPFAPIPQDAAPSPALPASRDMSEPSPSPAPRRFLTVTLNPLPMIAGRYGANVELVPRAHHAIVVSAYWQRVASWVLDPLLPEQVDTRSLPGRFGGELGYRFYSGREGAAGLFAGASVIAMPMIAPRVNEQLRAEVVNVDALGGAIDVGAQAILGSGFTLGGGLGVMALAYTPPASVTPPPGVNAPRFAEPHVLPRILLTAGWSF